MVFVRTIDWFYLIECWARKRWKQEKQTKKNTIEFFWPFFKDFASASLLKPYIITNKWYVIFFKRKNFNAASVVILKKKSNIYCLYVHLDRFYIIHRTILSLIASKKSIFIKRKGNKTNCQMLKFNSMNRTLTIMLIFPK